MDAVLAVMLAAVLIADRVNAVRDARRATRRNRAMHELRRPLQSISLALAAPAPDLECVRACLDQARGALEGLEAAVNCRRRARAVAPTTLPELIAALERRWRHRGVEVRVPRRATALDADPIELGAALDNLVANSLVHGTGPVTVHAFAAAEGARVEIRDGGPRKGAGCRPAGPRHGHGLGVVAEAAASHGGSLLPAQPARGEGTVAALSLPCEGPARPVGFPRGPAG